MVLKIALLGGSVLADGTEELPRIQVQFNVLLVVAAVCGLIVTVGTGQRFGPIVDLASMPSYLMLVGCQVIAALAFKWTLSCTQVNGDIENWNNYRWFRILNVIKLSGATYRQNSELPSVIWLVSVNKWLRI